MPTGSLGHGVCNLGFLLWGFVGFRLPGFVSAPDVNYGCSVYAFLSEALVGTNNLTPSSARLLKEIEGHLLSYERGDWEFT